MLNSDIDVDAWIDDGRLHCLADKYTLFRLYRNDTFIVELLSSAEQLGLYGVL